MLIATSGTRFLARMVQIFALRDILLAGTHSCSGHCNRYSLHSLLHPLVEDIEARRLFPACLCDPVAVDVLVERLHHRHSRATKGLKRLYCILPHALLLFLSPFTFWWLAAAFAFRFDGLEGVPRWLFHG